MAKYFIVNADDIGASTGINHGILQCHTPETGRAGSPRQSSADPGRQITMASFQTAMGRVIGGSVWTILTRGLRSTKS
jgi:hypothetical protein